MSVDTSALRSLAINASPGPWRNGADFLHYSSPEVTDDKTFSYYVTTDNDAAFIAAANPLTVIEMVDELASLRSRLAESDLERIRLRSGLREACEAVDALLDGIRQQYAGWALLAAKDPEAFAGLAANVSALPEALAPVEAKTAEWKALVKS